MTMHPDNEESVARFELNHLAQLKAGKYDHKDLSHARKIYFYLHW